MPLPDHLADLERKVSARLNEALAEMRRAVEAGAQRASSALLSELDKIGPLGTDGLVAEQDLLEMTREGRDEARRDLARALRLALVEFDRTRTQSAVLEALLASARPFGDRAAIWLVRPQELLGWASVGFAGEPVAGVTHSHAASAALQRLAEGRGGVHLTGTEAAHLASVLEIAAPKQALLLPLVLRDRIAAVLYVDSAAANDLELEALQMLAHAAAQRLELQALSTRSYTPTLFIDLEAPASERGLALWNPEALAAETAVLESAPAAAQETSWRASPAAVDTSGAAAGTTFQAATAVEEEEHDTLAEAIPTVASGLEPELFEHPPEPPAAEIAWEMEEADETALIGGLPDQDLLRDRTPERASFPGGPAVGGTPTHEIPLAPPAPDLAAAEWREVDETTAPHATYSGAATQTFSPPPAVTNEFPQPSVAERPAPPPTPPSGVPAASAASTIAFVPPVVAREPDLTEDATVRIQRSSLQAPAPVAPEPEAPEEQTHPSIPGPGLPEDEPTIMRGARTTEVIAPPDLQGPGWAFTSTRSPRGSGENALHEEARRLARLLVSEIKLYNEDQVEEGRHNRDIYHRLKDDIDRSRQIYEERVHESVRGTTDYFQQELVRSLAGGDPRALGI